MRCGCSGSPEYVDADFEMSISPVSFDTLANFIYRLSKGAFVVRAVAGLLHTFGSIASAGQPEFSKDFKKVLKDAERHAGGSGLLLSPVCQLSET